MNIEEAGELRRKLEDTIASALREFETKTGACVACVDVHKFRTMTQRGTGVASVVVRVEL